MEKAHTFAVETYQQRLEEEQAEEARVQKDLEAYHLDTASIRQKTEFAAANLQRVLGELGKLRNEGEELTRSQEQAREDTRSREAGMEALRKEMEEAEQSILKTEERIQALQEQKEKQSTSHKSFFSRREELSSRMNELDKELFRLNSQKEKLDETSENLMNHMWAEYELTYNAALPLRKGWLWENLQELKKSCSGVKEEIKGLGQM